MIFDAEFKDWMRFHCMLLCISHPDYKAGLEAWKPLLVKLKATPEELDAASVWLLEDPDRVAQGTWAQHFGWIRGHILKSRRVRKGKKSEEPRSGISQEFLDKLKASIGRVPE